MNRSPLPVRVLMNVVAVPLVLVTAPIWLPIALVWEWLTEEEREY